MESALPSRGSIADGLRQPLQFSANDDGVPASKRVGRKTDLRRKIHNGVRKSRSSVRRRPRRELAGQRLQAAAVVAARSCNPEPEPGKAQSYLCRRSYTEPFQIRMPILPIPLRNLFF